jgi:pilus assembly protein CpaF
MLHSNSSTPRGTSVNPGRGNGRGPAAFAAIREKVQRRLLTELSPTANMQSLEAIRPLLEQIFSETLAEEQLPLSRSERADLFKEIVANLLGFGLLDPLLRDDTITEILVNGPDRVYIERAGLLQETDLRFKDASELRRIIDRIVTPLGRRVDESSPMVDARLPDGSRVNVIIPPLSLNGCRLELFALQRTHRHYRGFGRAPTSPAPCHSIGGSPSQR